MTIEELRNQFTIQKNKINVFIYLQKNDKLMENKIEKNLYREPPGYFQSWKRWWYGEDKFTTFHHLDGYFSEFMKFLDLVVSSAKANLSLEIIQLGKDIADYINIIIPGIHILKTTYPHYEELHCKIDSIIITMIDFKKDFRTIPSPEIQQRKRSNSFNL